MGGLRHGAKVWLGLRYMWGEVWLGWGSGMVGVKVYVGLGYGWGGGMVGLEAYVG